MGLLYLYLALYEDTTSTEAKRKMASQLDRKSAAEISTTHMEGKNARLPGWSETAVGMIGVCTGQGVTNC
jgi:hypothetical protein